MIELSPVLLFIWVMASRKVPMPEFSKLVTV